MSMNETIIDKIKMKDVPDYEGLYAATSCGKIWDYRRERFLSQWSNGTPYMLVTLCKDGTRKNMRVHRLIAMTYLENPDNLPHVEHENQNPKDNYLNNLRWSDVTVNSCNRRKNIPILDRETGEEYCSLARAVKGTGVSRRKIIKQCDHYKNTGEPQRFIYLKGLPWDEYNKFMWECFMKRHNRKTA